MGSHSGIGSLTFDNGEIITSVPYFLRVVSARGFITISGSITENHPALNHARFGTNAILTTKDGERIPIMFNQPPKFIARAGPEKQKGHP